MRLHRPRRWSALGRVERVDAYTRVSLYVLLWGFCVSLLVATDRTGTDALGLVSAIVGGVVVTGLGSVVLAAVIGLYPRTGPLPWRILAPLLVAGTLYLGVVGLSLDGELRGAVTVVTVVNLTGALGGVPDSRLTAALLIASAVITGLVGGEVVNLVAGAVIGALVIFSVRASLWLLGTVTELDTARHAQSQLAVAEERLRFSRDVHDVLGRRLSTIAVQAELAATLAERGDDRAAARMLEVRGVAHEALAEARELARGYRPTDLTTELDGAGSLLRSAGIEVEVEVGVVPRGWHEAAGWVVREAVTNVLRHSAARRTLIRYDAGELRIQNDGVAATTAGSDPGSSRAVGGEVGGAVGGAVGAGLRGLRERLEPLGATLRTETDGDRWVVLATLPGAGPLSATAPAARPSAARPTGAGPTAARSSGADA